MGKGKDTGADTDTGIDCQRALRLRRSCLEDSGIRVFGSSGRRLRASEPGQLRMG